MVTKMHRRIVAATANRVLRVETYSLPEEADGPGLIVPDIVGICGTDLDILARSRLDAPTVIGHEAVVRVRSQAHDEIDFANPADVFVINPVDPQHQDRIIGHTEEGMLQEAVRIARSRVSTLLVPALPGLDPYLTVLAEPLGAAIYGIELLTYGRSAKRLLVVGAGPIGLLTAIAGRLYGIPEVSIVDMSENRVRYAVDKELVESGSTSLSTRFNPDTVALCVGRSQRSDALRRAIDVASPQARIDLVTGFPPGETASYLPSVDLNSVRRRNVCGRPRRGYAFPTMTDTGKRLELTGHRGTSARHLHVAMELLAKHPSEFRGIVTDVVDMDTAPNLIEALLAERMQPDRAPYRKIIVDMTRTRLS